MTAIAIVGCGVAGQAAALFLHRAGHRVEIFERFETAGPAGAGLLIQPTGLAVLERLGLAESALSHGAKVTRLLGHSRRGRVVLDVSYDRYRRGSFGLGMQRPALFGLLHGALKSEKIALTTGAKITEVETADRYRLVDKAGRRHGPFDLVIVADGAESALRARHGAMVRAPRYPYGAIWTVVDAIGAPNEMLRQVYDGTRRMAGILPIGRRPDQPPGTQQVAIFWSLRNDTVEALRAAGLDAWRRELETYWPDYAAHAAQVADFGVLLHAQYRDVVMKTPIAGRILFIGDAAHGTSPQLGLGANLALLDAAALSDALAETTEIDTTLALYDRRRRRHTRCYQWASRVLTPYFQSERDFLGTLRDLFMGPVGRLPFAREKAAALMAGVSLDPIRRLDLAKLRSGDKR